MQICHFSFFLAYLFGLQITDHSTFSVSVSESGYETARTWDQYWHLGYLRLWNLSKEWVWAVLHQLCQWKTTADFHRAYIESWTSNFILKNPFFIIFFIMHLKVSLSLKKLPLPFVTQKYLSVSSIHHPSIRVYILCWNY